MQSIVLQDTLTLLEVVEVVTTCGGSVGAVMLWIIAAIVIYYSPELNVKKVIFSSAMGVKRPNTFPKLAVTLTV